MLGEIVVPVKMPVTRDKTERPHGALLQLDTGFLRIMYRIGGRQRSSYASSYGVAVGIPLLIREDSNWIPSAGNRTMSGGQFDWGGRLLKSSGGAQRLSQHGRKPCKECKRIR